MTSLHANKVNPKGFHKSQLKFYIFLIPLAIFMALPIIYIVFHAFKPIDELFAYPPKFFVQNATWQNFIDLFDKASTTGVPMTRYLFNSVFVSLVTVVSTLIISAMAGFALSKKQFKYKKVLFELNTIALMFVAAAATIPRYLIIVQLGLIDNFFAHIFPLIAMPVGVFLVKQFIDGIPDELLEAARMDGATDRKIFMSIILPLIKPTLATIAILSFMAVWNSTEASSLYINDESLKTFAFYMTTLTSQTGNSVAGQGISAAAALIMFLPNLIIFIIMQRQVMNTMAHSGIK
ncbi:MAG: carbohydrate ABC transporter permease [Culicoidibacterales bacterium]